ncbi:hypothetical protein CANARDRAFT_29338 [[Candida] arabinofermentans NRRL YB-2248]|uniref:J domain-containing protein n=1 Tax=[Candida] arabinofermentans NRRL YB-2248 TaxID=983967 RepID=A0A1E4SXH9_9ASCO|nr:hypothetical protein CANARDRAFT_29338 [[Candida] arabinofermentans NRRL YB-2248]
MSQSRYDYDENSETWPYFVLTGLIVPLIPTTISYVWDKLSTSDDDDDEKSNDRTDNWFKTYNHDTLSKFKSNIQSKKLFTKKLLFIIIGWILVIYLCILANSIDIPVNESNFNPWKILGIDELADEKVIKTAYRKLSIKFHPDKVDTSKMSQLEMDQVDNLYVSINKAYKALTDETIKENFLKYGNPDGPSDVKHGIALPKFLIDGPTSPLLVLIYILLIAVILPLVVSSWWNGVKSYTKQGLHVDTASYFLTELINFNPAKLTQISTVLKDISHATEFQLIDKSLTPSKVESLLLSQINRTKLSPNDELLKYKVVSIAPKLILGYIDIASIFRNTEICMKLIDAHRCLIQALNIESSAKINKYKQILQLPGVSIDKLNTLEPIYTLGKLLKKPTISPSEFLSNDNYESILKYASNIPLIEPIDCKFKVPGENYIPPASNVHINLKFFIKSPKQLSKPELSKLSKNVIETQLNELETIENLKNPFKLVEDQPKIKLTNIPPYFPDINYLKENNGWIAFLIVQRDAKLAESPAFLTRVDLSNLKLTPDEFLKNSDAIVSTFKIPLTSPTPKEEGSFQFRLILKNLIYFGSDLEIPLNLNVEDKPITNTSNTKDLYEIEDPDEDSLAGAFAQLRGEKVKKVEYEDDSSDDDSDDSDDDEDGNDNDTLNTSDWTDIDTDTEVEEDALDK